jgi:hypothetical protein
MTSQSKIEYELQRQANLLLAQAGPLATRNPDQAEAIEKAQLALEQARARKPAQAGGQLMGGDTTGLDVDVALGMAQVPTSFVHVLDNRTPLVTFRIKNSRSKKARVKLVTRVAGYSSDAIDTVEVEAKGSDEVKHFPVFHHDSIAGVTEARAAALCVRVEDLDGNIERENTYRIVLLPRSSGYLWVTDAAGQTVDLTPYLAAWVTPNAPPVMQLIRDAAATHPTRTIVGYQPRTAPNLADIVHGQVAAIFSALKAREVTYVNSIVAFNLAGDAFVQRIRLPRESLEMRSANCIDGVVLMASALEAASLNPAIVLVPGHAFLAYELGPDTGTWDFIETTMIGSASFEEARDVGRRTAQTMAASRKILPIPALRSENGIFPME